MNQLESFMEFHCLQDKFEENATKLSLIEQEMKAPKLVSNRLKIANEFIEKKVEEQQNIKKSAITAHLHKKKKAKEAEFIGSRIYSESQGQREGMDTMNDMVVYFRDNKERTQKMFNNTMKNSKKLDKIEKVLSGVERHAQTRLDSLYSLA